MPAVNDSSVFHPLPLSHPVHSPRMNDRREKKLRKIDEEGGMPVQKLESHPEALKSLKRRKKCEKRRISGVITRGRIVAWMDLQKRADRDADDAAVRVI